MTAYTRLERTVLEALAWDLSGELPSLGAQITAGRPGRRRNTGFGLFTEIESAASVGASGPTGDLGTVHLMVGALRDPIAFKVRVRNGQLLGLIGDSYLQDTRAIDFERVAFDQVFTVDEDGESVAFASTVPPAREPLLASTPPPRPAAPPPPKPAAQTPAPKTSPPVARSRPAPPTKHAEPATAKPVRRIATDGLFDAIAPDIVLGEPTDAERTGLTVAAWGIPFAIAVVLILGFEVPMPPVFVLGYLAARVLQRPSSQAAMRRGLIAWRKARQASETVR